MKNYIPLDFFSNNKTKTYTSEYLCLKNEGSAASFDPKSIKLTKATIVDGVVVEDSSKVSDAGKEVLITEAYNSMVKDVYDEMENVFGTRNDVSASAFAATYEAMLKRPENYIDATLGFSSEAEVTTYAMSKISTSDAYGVFRLKRIAQYQAEKTAILGA